VTVLSSLQENLLCLLIFHPKEAQIVRNTIELDQWGGIYRQIATRCYEHLDRFKAPPGDHLPDILSDKLESKNQKEAALYTDVLENIHASKEGINAEYVMTQLSTFVKRQSLRSIAVELAKELQRDTEASLEKAEQLIASANTKSLTVFDPGTQLSDANKALKFLEIEDTCFPTGIPELDKRNFGPTRKEMWLFIANAKRGKCIAEGQPIMLADGRYLPIEQFPVGSSVPAFNEVTGRFEAKRATLKFNGVKPVFNVVTRTGRNVRLTGNHPLLTPTGWKHVSQLKVGDKIAAPKNLPMFGADKMDVRKAKILGYLIADGGMSKNYTITFTKHDLEIVNDFKGCLVPFGAGMTPSSSDPNSYYINGNGGANKVVAFLRANNLMKKKSNIKEVPQTIFKLQKAGVAAFLSALFTCDGSIYKEKRPTFEYGTTSYALVRGIDHLLTRFGIGSKIRERWQLVAGRPYISYTLTIRGRPELHILNNEIGLLGQKGRKLNSLMSEKFERKGRGSYLTNHVKGDVYFDRIKAITPSHTAKTYDLSVEGHHNFVAGNILVHNSWSLIHLAKMALMHRIKVCHITLEMSEARCAQRYFQTLFALPKRAGTYNTTRLELNDVGHITGLEDRRVTPKLALNNPHIRRKLSRKIKRWSGRLLKNIYIKQFPTGSLTVQQLEGYLDNLEVTQQFIPDLLIVDYPDLMRLDKDNVRGSLDEIYKRLRGIAVTRNIALAIVSQSHRESAKAKQVGAENVSEAYSKVMHADTIITYSQTETEHKLGLARLHVAGGRNDEDKLSVVVTQQYGIGNFVIDSALMRGNYWGQVEIAAPRESEDD
jgi:hypothetical protein